MHEFADQAVRFVLDANKSRRSILIVEDAQQEEKSEGDGTTFIAFQATGMLDT